MVGLLFFSKRKHNCIERLQLVVEMLLYNLCLAALAIGFVAHDLLRLILYIGIFHFVGSIIGIC